MSDDFNGKVKGYKIDKYGELTGRIEGIGPIDAKLLNGSHMTVINNGDGTFRVEGTYEGPMNPDELAALVSVKTREVQKSHRQPVEEPPKYEQTNKKGCFPTIIKIGAALVAVSLVIGYIRGRMERQVEPTTPPETTVQETIIPPKPEYYEAKVFLNEDMYASGTLYSTTNPFTLQDIYPEDEFQFSEYQESIGRIETSLEGLSGIWNVDDLSQAYTLQNLAYDLYAAYGNQYWMEENAINKTSDLKDNVNAASPKHELHQVQLNELEKQQNITSHNYNVAAGVYRSGFGYCRGKSRFK